MSNQKMDYVPIVIEGETYFAWGYHFKQLFVHEPPTELQHSLAEWIVTHKESSAALASFNNGSEAIAFAKWANKQMDFDAYWQHIQQFGKESADDAYKTSIELIKAKRASYRSVYERWLEPIAS